jgi:hypothetical protein
VHKYLGRQKRELRRCYRRRLVAWPALAGVVTTTFMIAPDGEVGSVLVEPGLDAELESCVASVVGAIRFPATRCGRFIQVSYPVRFRLAEK